MAFNTGSCVTSLDMILSMTGFASASAERPGISLAVELRSVNHRYLDVTVKLAEELRMLEPALRDRLSAAQKRGKVECRVSLARTAGASESIAINAERVRQLAGVAAGVAKAIPGTPPLTTADILRWPGVIVDATIAPEALAELVDALVDQALRELTSARAREGAKLRAVLEARCTDIEAQVARVAPRIPALHAAFLEKLGGRLREAGLDPNEERLKQEFALFATRIDVAEEVARLSTHVAEMRRVLAHGGAVGKRLDFLAQELHREANTLGSKSVDAELSQISLELKVLIEQMREQVQNLE
ncbi:MAG: YicC/YloC family endoribonuclease [Burkholderiales bacterium]